MKEAMEVMEKSLPKNVRIVEKNETQPRGARSNAARKQEQK